jgi:hypothetical protein
VAACAELVAATTYITILWYMMPCKFTVIWVEHIPLSSEYMEGINLFEQVSLLMFGSWDGICVVTRLEAV